MVYLKKIWIVIIVIIAIIGVYLYQSSINIDTNEKYKIGILISGSERMEKVKGLKEGLQNLGYIDGMNISYVIKNANNKLDLMKKYAAELDNMNLDVIVAGGAIETKYLKNNNGKTPVIFLGVADAIHLHLVDSYQRPNGRITGVENGHVELSAKRFQLFKLLIPDLKRVIIVYDKKIEASTLSLSRVKEIAKDTGLEIYPISVSNKEQYEHLESLSFQKDDGILVLPSYYLENVSHHLGALALKNNVPIFGVNSNDVKHGFLLSYGVSYYDQGAQCSSMVSQIFNGVAPKQIPVEKPDTVQLLVNEDTAEKLNIQFSPAGNAFIHRVKINNVEGD